MAERLSNMAEGAGPGPEVAVPKTVEQAAIKPAGRIKYIQELPGFNTAYLDRYIPRTKDESDPYWELYDPELPETDVEGRTVIDLETGKPKPRLVGRVAKMGGAAGWWDKLTGQGDQNPPENTGAVQPPNQPPNPDAAGRPADAHQTGERDVVVSPVHGLSTEDIHLLVTHGHSLDEINESVRIQGQEFSFSRYHAALEGIRHEQARLASQQPAEGGEIVESGEVIESPVPGLSIEEVNLFAAHGISIEDLNAVREEHGEENFLNQAKSRLREYRAEEAEARLTPEEKAQKEAEERAKRITQLQVEWEELRNMPADTDQERSLIELRRVRIREEYQKLQELQTAAGGGEGGPPALGSPEESEQPEVNSLEYEASAERGHQIARGIIEQEALLHAGKFEKVKWGRLNELYLEQKIHIEAQRIIRLRIKVYETDEPSTSTSPEVPKVNKNIFEHSEANQSFKDVGEWLKEYREGRVTDLERFQKEVDIYFAEAKRVGFLKGLDTVLATTYQEVVQGLKRNRSLDEIMFGLGGIPGVQHRVENTLNALRGSLRTRLRSDPQMRLLAGVAELYAQMALDRFADSINNDDQEGMTQEGYIENEFHLEGQTESAPEETYWRLQHGWYVEIYAQTEEEFMIAAESYISRLEAITAAPEKIFEESTRFIDVLSKSEGAKKLRSTFVEDLILGIEARVGVYGADQANELYQVENYKKFMDYINKDGRGPDRWLTLVQSLDGQVAAALWSLDKDPRWESLFALYGSRGQLSDASVAQRTRDGSGLYWQVYDLLAAELLGVRIKDKRNIPNLTKFSSDGTFVDNFEGLYQYGKVPEGRFEGDGNIRFYERMKAKNITEKDKKLTTAQRRAIRLGRLQWELRPIDAKGGGGGKKLDDLSEGDRKFYDTEFAKVKKAVTIALQVYGALGEKSKRGGGVFKTDTKRDDQSHEYQYFIPVHMAEKFVQFAETMTKIKYADKSAKYRTEKVAQAREKAIAELKANGYEAKLYEYDDRGNRTGPMLLKRPKEDSSHEDGLARDIHGNVEVEQKSVDFYTATHHIYGDWSGHTYWSYQEEDRHMILSDATFEKARAIKDGRLRPEDADLWAIQLLIIDPTLRRVRRFTKNFEDRERKLTAAAVEDSYQSHWRIGRELYRAFFPKYGEPTEEIGIYYGLQDFGGFRKMVEHTRARIAEDPERFARRGRRLLPDLHIPIAPLAEYLGQGTSGALGALRMMDAPIYRGAGTFALDKFAAQAEVAYRMYAALLGERNREGTFEEGLLLKPTNNSDKLRELIEVMKKFKFKGVQLLNQPPGEGNWETEGLPATEDEAAIQNKACYAFIESLGRLKRYEQLFTVMETDIRNASGAQWLEEVEIFTDGGAFMTDFERRLKSLPDIANSTATNNTDLKKDDLGDFLTRAQALMRETESGYNAVFNEKEIDEGSKSMNTGSGRHSAKIFHDTFGNFLIDLEERGGAESYPGESLFYRRIFDKIIYWVPDPKNPNHRKLKTDDDTIWKFIFTKLVPT